MNSVNTFNNVPLIARIAEDLKLICFIPYHSCFMCVLIVRTSASLQLLFLEEMHSVGIILILFVSYLSKTVARKQSFTEACYEHGLIEFKTTSLV